MSSPFVIVLPLASNKSRYLEIKVSPQLDVLNLHKPEESGINGNAAATMPSLFRCRGLSPLAVIK